MLRQDFTYAVRTLRKAPAFAITAILTLALGIGANTAIFTLIHAVLLKPLHYERPEQLMRVARGATSVRFDALRQAQCYSAVAAANIFAEDVALSGAEGPEPLRAVRVSANYLDVLGLRPLRGRSFTVDEEKRSLPVAMISAELWERRFGSNPRVLGTAISLGSGSYTVIGILPRHLALPFPEMDVWRVWDIDADAVRTRTNSPIHGVIGRLKDGVTIAQANSELSVINRQYAAEHRAALDARPATLNETVLPLKDSLVNNVRQILWMLFGAVGLVLLMACANVASLMLARATSRGREFAVRAALGASRGRLVAQQMTESLVLASIGGVLGVFLAWASLNTLASLPGLELPRAGEIRMDGMVLAFACFSAMLTSVLFGLAPSLSASKPSLAAMMKASGEGAAFGWPKRLALWLRPRGLLVVAQVGVSMVLLIGAALLLESLASLRQVKPGFEPQNLLTMQITLPRERHEELVRRVEALPGVRAAAVTLTLPTTGWAGTPVQAADQPPLKLNERVIGILQTVTPGYFRTLGIPLRRGRDFTSADTSTSQLVAVINESMAQRFWPNQEAVGRYILVGTNPTPVLVTGLAADVRQGGLADEMMPGLYRPRTQTQAMAAMFAVRTVGDPLRMVNTIRQEMVAIDRQQAITNIRTMEAVIDASEGQRRSIATLLGVFAATGLLLVMVGLYGVMAYSVSQRTKEVGIRRALGAQRGDVLWLVLGQGLSLAVAGVGFGIAGGLALTRVMAGLLFRVSATDPSTFAAVGALLILVGLAASYVPARRALRIQPAIAIKGE